MLYTILKLFSSGFESSEIPMILAMFAALLFVTFVCLPVHESAHALSAYWLGDETGRLKGRISLNPFAHLTWQGLLMMFVFGFGYARPVPVNIYNFKIKNRKVGFALTSVAGPISNILLTCLFCFFAMMVKKFGLTATSPERLYILYVFSYYVAFFNANLAVFNLIPIPPLDGSRLLTAFLPDKLYYRLLQYERYFILGIFALSFFLNRILNFSPIGTVASWLMNVFMTLFSKILL